MMTAVASDDRRAGTRRKLPGTSAARTDWHAEGTIHLADVVQLPTRNAEERGVARCGEDVWVLRDEPDVYPAAQRCKACEAA